MPALLENHPVAPVTNPNEFTPEQKEYLAGFLAALAQRGLPGAADAATSPAPLAASAQDPVPPPQAETRFGTPIADLTKQERWKLEEDPLDIWDKLLSHADHAKFPDEADTFRFRYHGLFYVAPAQNAFMLRCRIPAGELTSAQLDGLADIADQYGGGYADITTRSNLQIRQIAPGNTIKVLTRLQELGLTARGSGVDNVRNITASPTAGIDPVELIDTRPLAKALHHYILNHRDLYGLPRKFNVAFDGGGSVSVVADTNDIGFLAVTVPEGKAEEAKAEGRRQKAEAETPQDSALRTPHSTLEGKAEGKRQKAEVEAPEDSAPQRFDAPTLQASTTTPAHHSALRTPESPVPGVYFRCELAGITGHKQFAKDAGILVKASECVAVTAAMIRVFLEHGDRTDRKKARLKYLLDKWGVEKFVAETQKKLGFPLVHFPREGCVLPHPPIRHGHIGVYKQAQKARNYVGVVIPVGRMYTRHMRRLALLAQNYGSGSVRLTPWQNLILPDVPDGFVETVKRNLVRIGLHYSASTVAGGLIACTGNTGCKWASTNTKGQAVELARYLEKRVKLDQPINIHLTGCPNSCAQHYVGDIGLLGTKTNMGGASLEAYSITLGGGFGADQAIGKEIFKGIPVSEVPRLLERVLTAYLDRRVKGESFAAFTRRHDVKTLQEMFSE